MRGAEEPTRGTIGVPAPRREVMGSDLNLGRAVGLWGPRRLPREKGQRKLPHVWVTRRPQGLCQQKLKLGADELPVTH